MDCPYLKYEDGGWLSYDHYCKVIGQKIGDQNNKTRVENTCKDNRFFDCPYYKKMKG